MWFQSSLLFSAVGKILSVLVEFDNSSLNTASRVSTVCILILNVSISASINTLLGTNTHLDLWSHLWFWLNSSICSKGSNKFTTLSVREDSQTVPLSWFTVRLFLSTGQHTNTFCNRFGISKRLQKGNNVSWSLLSNNLFFQGQLSNTVKSYIQ